jgi:glycyl-tRNA synthetase beta chain
LAVAQYPADLISDSTTSQVFDYMIERFRAWYEDENIPVEVFRAVSAKRLTRPIDIQRRVHAVHAFTALPEAGALAAANKRVSNILGKLDESHEFSDVNTNLLVEAEEKGLYSALESIKEVYNGHLSRAEYTETLATLASLRAPIDAFFDGVMVNAEDPALRSNRLSLLKTLRDVFLEVADISQLAASK